MKKYLTFSLIYLDIMTINIYGWLWYITMILMFYSRLYNINLGFILSLKIQNVNLLILYCYTYCLNY